jgi:hypothetical protein
LNTEVTENTEGRVFILKALRSFLLESQEAGKGLLENCAASAAHGRRPTVVFRSLPISVVLGEIDKCL